MDSGLKKQFDSNVPLQSVTTASSLEQQLGNLEGPIFGKVAEKMSKNELTQQSVQELFNTHLMTKVKE